MCGACVYMHLLLGLDGLEENINSRSINYENGTLTNTILKHMNYLFTGLTVCCSYHD